jgi:hypothetical protein
VVQFGKGIEGGEQADKGGHLDEDNGQKGQVIPPQHSDADAVFEYDVQMREQVDDDIQEKKGEQAEEKDLQDGF